MNVGEAQYVLVLYFRCTIEMQFMLDPDWSDAAQLEHAPSPSWDRRWLGGWLWCDDGRDSTRLIAATTLLFPSLFARGVWT